MLRPFPAATGLAVVLVAFFLSPTPAAPTHTYVPHTNSVHAATFQSADADAVHLTLPDGDTLDADIKPTTIFIKQGGFVDGTDFTEGEKVFVRTRARPSDGGMSLVLLADEASLLAIDAAHGKTLRGYILTIDDKYCQVQPKGVGTVPLEVHLAQKTIFRKGGSDATADDFAVGESVAMETRGGSNGLPLALVVSDDSADAAAQKKALKISIFSGIAHDVDPVAGTLTLVSKGKPKQIITITPDTKIKVRTVDATLQDIVDGMRVSVRAGHDSAGSVIALSLSVSETPKKKMPLARKTTTRSPRAKIAAP